MDDEVNMSRRIRRSPYIDRVIKAGARGFSVSNHMFFPKSYQSTVEEDYWHLREHVQLWDVSCQRQVQVLGPDAEKLVQLITPRNIGKARVGDCFYIHIVDHEGGILNDPVMLKLADDKFWLSIADSDILLYVLGLALGKGFDVDVIEPDVSPLAVQGPKAEELMVDIFGAEIRDVRFFKFGWFDFNGTQQLIARSGFSRQGGFEIYLNGSEHACALWDSVWKAGQKYNIKPGSPNFIERIEGGLFSFGNEMLRENNPLEFGFRKYCTLDGSIDFLGLKPLQKINADGVQREVRGIVFGGGRNPLCTDPWPVMVDDLQVGQITSGIWSPRLEKNVGLSLIDRDFWNIGQAVTVDTLDGQFRKGSIVDLPMEQHSE